MITTTSNELREQLIKLSDEKFKNFHSNLCPGVDSILGIKLPILRDFAKSLSKQNDYEVYLNEDKKYYEEIMIEGSIIGYLNIDNHNRFNYIKILYPK